jgi:hypothetical protein
MTSIRSFQSASVSGLIDRSMPFVVAQSPKNGGPYEFGGEISVVFNEPIDCLPPYSFAAVLKLPSRILEGSDLAFSCQYDTLGIYILASSGVTVCLVACTGIVMM